MALVSTDFIDLCMIPESIDEQDASKVRRVQKTTGLNTRYNSYSAMSSPATYSASIKGRLPAIMTENLDLIDD